MRKIADPHVDTQTEKQGKAALVIGAVMLGVFLIVGVVLWAAPTLSRGRIDGEALGLPFTGTGACFLSMAGLLIASIGLRIVRGTRAPHRPEPPLRKPLRPSHGEWTSD